MRKAYLDIETSYVGPYSDQRVFRGMRNHRITVIESGLWMETRTTLSSLLGKTPRGKT
jgi:hypothetical protein